MKQLQFTFEHKSELENELKKVAQWHKSNLCSPLIIHVYTDKTDQKAIEEICNEISSIIPDAKIVGCSTYGNILHGDFTKERFAVTCTLFEYPSTKVEVFQYELTKENQKEITEILRNELMERPWVKCVEMLTVIRGISVTNLCDGLSKLPENIQVFGGGALVDTLSNGATCVFSSEKGYQEHGIVFILIGGEEFHVYSDYVTGWKPLGRYLDVTDTDGAILKELNGRPAYETYYKYLHIKNDENFFYNTLEFPFLYRLNGIDIMRAPTASNPDGSLTMTADIDRGVKARIAYGDPWTILNTAWQEGEKLADFAPECIHVFSCAARRTFWGDTEAGKETEPYQILAPTSGFYTSGEFLRTNGFVNQHNVTQIVVAMREGNPKPYKKAKTELSTHNFEGKISMINRMATFIKATTDELIEANRKLNEIAVTDVLTKIGNKTAYTDKIKEINTAIAKNSANFTVIVFDLNGLKFVNDNYGHEYGDLAIKDTANAISDVFGKKGAYRIGGDEFAVITENTDVNAIRSMLDALDETVEEQNKTEKPYKMPLSISKGYAVFDKNTDKEYSDVFKKADEIMYRNKADYYKTHDRRRARNDI